MTFKILFVSNCENGYQVLSHLLDNNESICGLITLNVKSKNTKNISGFREFDDICSRYNIDYIKIADILKN